MSKVLCHIPHSGTYIPEWAKCDIIITVKELHSLVDFMTDKNIDKMWEFVPDKNKVVATHSRLITDMERFRNDSDEPMAEKGMGLYYTHSPAGKMFRIKNEASYIKCLEIYDAHHSLLEERVRNCLNKHSRCIILGCHSFHDEMDYTGYDIKDYPDVCIGINGNMSKESWLITEAFNSKGYSVKVNEPFAGSLKPLLYLNDSCVTSIMIELNRRIYDNLSFKKVQNICKSIYRKLND